VPPSLRAVIVVESSRVVWLQSFVRRGAQFTANGTGDTTSL
jgi:hypothetical protein